MFSEPEKNLKRLGIEENMVIADLGAGSGFYTLLSAPLVPYGKVYAIEIQKDFLETLRKKINDSGFLNVECFLGDIEILGGTKIADQVVDRVIISNVFSQLEDKDGLIKEIKRILKPKGKILFIDWSENSFLMSKKNKSFWSKDKIKDIFLKEDLISEKEIETGDHHYGIIFKLNEK